MPPRRDRLAQLTFEDPSRLTRDGRPKLKPGPKGGPRPAVRHRTREVHAPSHPVLITMRAVSGLPSFLTPALFASFEHAVRTTRREDFRIVDLAVQADHLHLIVEADDNGALARGMKSFSVRANRLFNAAHGRGRGPVWNDSFVRRELTTEHHVREVLDYFTARATRAPGPCEQPRTFLLRYLILRPDADCVVGHDEILPASSVPSCSK